MFYTQIVFVPTHRQTFQLLDDVYQQHKFIMSGFKGYSRDKLGRVLYRMETQKNGILAGIIQSAVEPAYENGIVNRGAVVSIQTKKVLFAGRSEPTFSSGLTYRFRIRANTVLMRDRDGKRVGIIREEALRAWFEKRAANIGARFINYSVIDEGYIKGNKDGLQLMFKVARYDGILRVTDGEKFTKTFMDGFGHAKSFGCGLLSLAKS